MIELRSDTFTLPTPAMLAAITEAALGDDVYGEDPTVCSLEKLASHKLGKQAACLMPSGTMANLTSIMAHCPRGTKVLVGNESDIYIYEAGGASICGGVIYEPVPTQPDGTLRIEDLEQALAEDNDDPQFALPSLICLENTHNRCGGTVLSLSYLEQVQHFAQTHLLPVHIDGARIFHAALALGKSAAEIASYATSVQFCLSKGLSAPIGSMVVGDASFIDRVRRIRKMLGGGMRQAGIIAAAGIIALEQMVDRLVEDHIHARRFAEGLLQHPEIQINLETVQTNIVIFRVASTAFDRQKFISLAHEHGLNLSSSGHERIRAVFHYGITTRDVDTALEIIDAVLKNLRRCPPPGNTS